MLRKQTSKGGHRDINSKIKTMNKSIPKIDFLGNKEWNQLMQERIRKDTESFN